MEPSLFSCGTEPLSPPRPLTPSHLGDLDLSFEFGGVHKALGLSWWMCSAWIWVPWMARENTRNQQMSSSIQTCPWWLDAPWKCPFAGWGRENPMSGTKGWWVCFYSTFYSTLFPLETPSAPRPLQPRCWNWDMGACSWPPQPASHKKQLIRATEEQIKAAKPPFSCFVGGHTSSVEFLPNFLF